MEQRDTYGKAFLQTMNLWRSDATVKEYVFARRFAKVAADLMGVPGVRLYHDQALYKEPGGGPTPWHQDQYYWPLDTPNTITMWMPLVDITPDMGVMTFASGSHKEGYLSALEISDASESHCREFIAKRGFPVSEPVAMRAGDATFHSGWTLHNATSNATTKMREVMTVIYYAEGARVCEPDNQGRRNDLATWFMSRTGEPKDLCERERGYFDKNKELMRYAQFRSLGLFVGSGVVEAGCRTVIGQRLKQSGMHWTLKGANKIIALRCCIMSYRWEDFWEQRACA